MKKHYQIIKPDMLSRRKVLQIGLASGAAIASTSLISSSAIADSCGLGKGAMASVDRAASGEVAAFAVSENPKKLPDAPFFNNDEQEITFADWQGKFVLVNIWATWCAPCRHEMPDLDKLQAILGSDNFEVVAISADRGSLDKPRAFYEEINISKLNLYHDPRGKVFNGLRQMGRARGLPFTMLMGPDGCEIGFMNGPAAWGSDDAVNLIKTAMAVA